MIDLSGSSQLIQTLLCNALLSSFFFLCVCVCIFCIGILGPCLQDIVYNESDIHVQ